MVKVLNWNGKDVPAELKDLPAGQYAIEPLDHELTPDEEQGLIEAMDELGRGEGIPHDEVMCDLRARAKR